MFYQNQRLVSAMLFAWFIIVCAITLQSCRRHNQISTATAIELIGKSDLAFKKLSSQLAFTDIVSHTSLLDFAKELESANLRAEGVLIERFFLGNDSATVISVQYFVTSHVNDSAKLRYFTVKRRLYANIDLNQRKSLNSVVLSSAELGKVSTMLMDGDAAALTQLRENADKERDVMYLKADSTWNALTILLDSSNQPR